MSLNSVDLPSLTDHKLDCDIKEVSVYEFNAISEKEKVAFDLSYMESANKKSATMAERCEAAGVLMQFFLLFQRNVTASLRNSVRCCHD